LKREAGWYKDAIIYQIHVRTFFDSNGDGIGDFQGLAQRLDYVQELGVTAIWLMPFFPSPLRDDGYDISDYRSVHPSYGTLDDFKTFLSWNPGDYRDGGEPHFRSTSMVPGGAELARQSKT
jgi:maltose alpha-D-glucosyltransferase/alpha-amylase